MFTIEEDLKVRAQEVHTSSLRDKFYRDRRIEHAIEFKHHNNFVCVVSMIEYLKDLGYTVGTKHFDSPIGFKYGASNIDVLHSLSQGELDSLDGLILNGKEGYFILFYTPPRY